MPEETAIGCARPTGGAVTDQKPADGPENAAAQAPQGGTRMISIGKPAPDFTAPAYLDGRFVSVRLSEYLGKWVVLCFYPGDFTFV
ncbi:redoxin domain-containing protein [Desulfolutivibrio sulfodismutans DSM 3696]|nr:redoxin domain-containing protein [Desulfolutivibrio sulfodismutans DSM 3696]